MEPAVATLDFAEAGAIIANMIESYLAAGAPPFNAEGADHAESEDCRSSSDAKRLHLHSSVDDGASAIQSGEHRAPVQSSVYSNKLRIVFRSCAPLTSRLRQTKGWAFLCQASQKS